MVHSKAEIVGFYSSYSFVMAEFENNEKCEDHWDFWTEPQ